ncbi:MAG: LON peptidase substrate-binding domain-containing protein [Saprospiraceae bacterium]|nr:LON peptidase substrate-binding domain-containing protein [Saprospiraceae bacterium]
MSYVMPQFPLEIVAFPGGKLPLHIFEPRYKQLAKECFEQNSLFGIIPVIKGSLQSVGTSMTVVKVAKTYPDGRMDIITQGIGLFKVLDFHKLAGDKLYPEAVVEDLQTDEVVNQKQADRIIILLKQLYSIMGIEKSLEEIHIQTPYDIARVIGLEIDQSYHLLQMKSLSERQKKIIEHLEKIIPQIKEAHENKKRIEMNGRFLHLNPPKI